MSHGTSTSVMGRQAWLLGLTKASCEDLETSPCLNPDMQYFPSSHLAMEKLPALFDEDVVPRRPPLTPLSIQYTPFSSFLCCPCMSRTWIFSLGLIADLPSQAILLQNLNMPKLCALLSTEVE